MPSCCRLVRPSPPRFDAPFAAANKAFSFDVDGPRASEPRASTPVTWRFPKRVATLPAAWLSASHIMGLQKPLDGSDWSTLQTSRFNVIDTEPNPGTSCARNVATGTNAGASLIYLGCPQTNADYRDGNPDLDNLVSQGWAYAYRLE